MKPRIGQHLWSSCAGENYGTIIAVGKDDNNTPIIDIEVADINNLVWIETETNEWPEPVLSHVELQPTTKIILRNLQYKIINEYIICNTPGNGCYRCTKLFTLK